MRSANNAKAQVGNSLNGYGRGTIAFQKNFYPQIVPKTANRNNGLDRGDGNFPIATDVDATFQMGCAAISNLTC